jgi:hypothetical protein
VRGIANPSPVGARTPQCFDLLNPGTARANTVVGTLTRDDIIVQTANGIDARTDEEFREIVSLIRAGPQSPRSLTGVTDQECVVVIRPTSSATPPIFYLAFAGGFPPGTRSKPTSFQPPPSRTKYA